MEFIVITGQIICRNGRPFEVVWSSDMEKHGTLAKAISYGFKIRGSDDFRIGAVTGNTLKRLSWMGEKQFSREEIIETANQLYLKF